MKKILELLNRWYKRLINTSNDIEVIPISIDTIDTAIRLAYDYVNETTTIYDDHIITNLSEQLKAIVISGGFVGIAYINGISVGLICVMVSIPEVFDSRKTATVSNLYVKPDFRSNPNILMSLIRSAWCFLDSNSVEIVRISCESEALREKYVRLFGFKPIYYQVILEVTN